MFGHDEQGALAAARRICDRNGLPADHLTRLEDSRTGVFQVGDTGLVLRLALPETTDAELARVVALNSVLAQAGVPVIVPAGRPQPISDGSGDRATLWGFEAATGEPLDWRAVGDAVARLHRAGGARLAARASGLGSALDLGPVRRSLDVSLTAGRLTDGDHELLTAAVGRAARDSARLDALPKVLTHGDLWPNNMLATPRGPVLCDPDRMSLAPADYDLSFVAALHAKGGMSDRQRIAFEAGYGRPLPDAATAEISQRIHYLRFTADVVTHSADTPQAAEYAGNLITRARTVESAAREATARELPA